MDDKQFSNTAIDILEQVVKTKIPHMVASAFVWSDTPEGVSYWSNRSHDEELSKTCVAKLTRFLKQYKAMAEARKNLA